MGGGKRSKHLGCRSGKFSEEEGKKKKGLKQLSVCSLLVGKLSAGCGDGEPMVLEGLLWHWFSFSRILLQVH